LFNLSIYITSTSIYTIIRREVRFPGYLRTYLHLAKAKEMILCYSNIAD